MTTPVSLVKLLRVGKRMLKDKEYLAADRAFSEALVLDPDSIDVHFHLALSKLRQGQLAMAEKHARKVLKLNPFELNARLNLGAIFHKRNNYPLAIKHYKMELVVQPDCLQAHYNLGIVYLIRKQWKHASQHLEKDLAVCAQNLNNIELEMKIYRRALRIEPDNVWALNNIGAVYNEKKKPKLAHAAFLKALKLAPADKRIKRNLRFIESILQG